jgi:hypothetical protein
MVESDAQWAQAEQAIANAAKSAKSANRAMVLTCFAVAVAILVLAIDNSIKRSIIAEAQQVRVIFRQFQEATSGLAAAVQDAASDRADDSSADDRAGDLAEPAGTRAAANSDAPARPAAKRSGKGSAESRP